MFIDWIETHLIPSRFTRCNAIRFVISSRDKGKLYGRVTRENKDNGIFVLKSSLAGDVSGTNQFGNAESVFQMKISQSLGRGLTFLCTLNCLFEMT